MEAIFISRDESGEDVNQSAVEMFGYNSKKEMKGISIIKFIADDSKDLVKGKIKTG